jgi:hypothetical protein
MSPHCHGEPISGASFSGDDTVLWRDCAQLTPQSKDKKVDASISNASGSSHERFPCHDSGRGVKKQTEQGIFGSRQSNVQTLRTREASLSCIVPPSSELINVPLSEAFPFWRRLMIAENRADAGEKFSPPH